MMRNKLVTFVILMILIICLTACSSPTTMQELSSEDSGISATIDEDEAVSIAVEKMGGEGYIGRYEGTVEYEGATYYVVSIKWLVKIKDVPRNYSYIGDCFVSLDGKKVYSGVYHDGVAIIDKEI